MTVTALPVRDEYTASAGQTIFNYTFLIFTNQDLNVYVTPAGQDADDTTDLTTAYTVDAGTIGSPIGGFITLASGTSVGDLVTIVSSIADNRTTDYQNSGDFLPDTVNDDFDRVVSLVKQVEDQSGRTLSFPQALQNATSLTLPLPVAGQYVVWNAAASGLDNAGAPGVVVPGTNVSTVGAMVADTSLLVGEFVFTNGYGSTGDGGDNSYEIVAAATGTADGGLYIDLPNTTPATQAKGLFPRGVRTVRQYGAVGNGTTDDVLALQACLDAQVRFLVPAGTYRVTTELVWSNYSSLVGEGLYTGARFDGGLDYDPLFNSTILYDGAGGVNSCVCRLSQSPVGDTFTDAGIPLVDSDLIAPEIDGILIDGNDLAEFGAYFYRVTTPKYKAVAATKCLEHGQFFIGCFNGIYEDVIAYNNASIGVSVGNNYFGWVDGAEIAINALTFNGITTRSNGSAKTYDQASPTLSLEGHGLFMGLGRGNTISRISSSSNDGAGAFFEGQSTSGSNHIEGYYSEGNMSDAGGEGRATAVYEAIISSSRLLTGFRFSEIYASPANGGRLRILDDTTDVINFDQIMTLENCGSREFEVIIQSSTRRYRVVKSYADYSTGEPPWFTDYSNVFASGIYSQGNPVTSIVVEGMLVSGSIVYGSSTGVATITFDDTLFSSNYIVDCTVANSSHRASATNMTTTGFDIEMTDLSGTPTTAQQVRFSCRSIRWFTV